MKAVIVGGVGAPMLCSSFLCDSKRLRNHRLCVSFSSPSSSGFRAVEQQQQQGEIAAPKLEYKPGVFDDLFLNLFRSKLVQDIQSFTYESRAQILPDSPSWAFKSPSPEPAGGGLVGSLIANWVEVGWDSNKPGYDGVIEVANRLMMKGTTNSNTIEAAVRVLRALFPPYLLELYKMLIAPLGGGKIAAMMVARVTALTCQWLMGPCKVNSVEIEDGISCNSGVYVERCKYLEESKCVGICLNTCKFPTQTFFKDYMGVPLVMEPNFADYSCQFKFGVLPPLPEDDSVLKEPCLEACPNAARRRAVARNIDVTTCPKT